MANAAIYRKMARVAINHANASYEKSVSDLKLASKIDTNFSVAVPDYVEVPANSQYGIAIEYLQAVSENATAQLQLRLVRVGETDEVVPIALLPAGISVYVKPMTPLFVDANVKTVFEVTGLLGGQKYSVYAGVYRWRKSAAQPVSPAGM